MLDRTLGGVVVQGGAGRGQGQEDGKGQNGEGCDAGSLLHFAGYSVFGCLVSKPVSPRVYIADRARSIISHKEAYQSK